MLIEKGDGYHRVYSSNLLSLDKIFRRETTELVQLVNHRYKRTSMIKKNKPVSMLFHISFSEEIDAVWPTSKFPQNARKTSRKAVLSAIVL